jgi:inorganic pyrophosphatase
VPATDPRFAHVRELDDVPQHQLNEIAHFFEVYKDLEPGKSSESRGWQGREAAESALLDARERQAGEQRFPLAASG